MLRPDVVWFGEVPYELDRIEQAVIACDVFVSIGTCLLYTSRCV